MYNIYHVTDVDIFIQANEFYEIPRGLDTYYIEAKPPGFEEREFIGLLSLELRGSQGRNLAGYMVVQNDLPNLGHMQFYEVPIESETKLLGPTSVREALDRDPDFAQLKTLLRNPRIGDNILYRVGEHDTFFLPVRMKESNFCSWSSVRKFCILSASCSSYLTFCSKRKSLRFFV